MLPRVACFLDGGRGCGKGVNKKFLRRFFDNWTNLALKINVVRARCVWTYLPGFSNNFLDGYVDLFFMFLDFVHEQPVICVLIGTALEYYLNSRSVQ